MIPIETVVRVSQYAINLVMAGKAYFGSGGVRLIENDRFVELYKLLPSYQTQQPGIMPINPFIESIWERERMARVAGTYRWGGITVALDADGNRAFLIVTNSDKIARISQHTHYIALADAFVNLEDGT